MVAQDQQAPKTDTLINSLVIFAFGVSFRDAQTAKWAIMFLFTPKGALEETDIKTHPSLLLLPASPKKDNNLRTCRIYNLFSI